MQEETILYDPENKKFCLLNATAAFLWDRLAEPVTAEQLREALCGQFPGVDRAVAERDVRTVLEEFRTLAVVETVAQQ
jgi:coenzyme PQQ synthesis protein D (PqqD)